LKIGMISVLGGLLVASALAQTGDQLYDGARSVRSQRISLQRWGSGIISESRDVVFLGAQSVRVSSKDYFQGGTLTFSAVKDFAKDFDDKTKVLRVTFFLEDAGMIYGKDLKSKDPNSPNATLSRVGHAVSHNSGKKGDLNVAAAIPFLPKIKKIRVILLTTDGKRSEIYVPVLHSVRAAGGWRSLGVPLHAINGFERTNKTVKALTLTTDTISTLYLGDVRVLSDTTPIDGSIESMPVSLLNLKQDAEITLSGYGDAGASPLVYTWDFDDRDGIQVDAEGHQVKSRLKRKGEYNVTLTISDFYGYKQPSKKTLRVKVTD
jgi:hypothetical protein